MENVTWKKRTLLGIMSASLLLGGVYTATEGSESNVGQEVSAAQSAKFASTDFKTTANLNMRTGAGLGNRILVTIPRGKEVTSDTKIGNWYKVSYNGKTGYVSGKYLTKVSASKSSSTKAPSSPKAPAVSKANKFQTTDNLNMRTGGSVKHKRILTIPRNGQVEYISKSGSWYKVKYNGKTGYVSSKYLKAVGTPAPEVKPAPETKPTPKPEAKPTPQATVKTFQTTDNLNMRTGASVKYKRILTIPRNGKVEYISKSGSWYKVKYNGKTGYVSSKYLKAVATPTPAPKPGTKPTPQVTVKTFQTTDNLNMRTGASVKNKRILTIPKGGKVEYISKSGAWYKVKYNGKTGYVSSKYLKSVATPKPKATAVKQSLMSRADAEAHISKYVTKSRYGYELKSGTGRFSIIVEFPSSNSGKAQMSVDGVNYVSGYSIKPEDFGQEAYEGTKEHYAHMNNAILAYAESQFGVGSKESKTLFEEVKQMTLFGDNGDVKRITLQGKSVRIAMEGVRTRVSY